jgi:iron complex transport system substrate-binding protein
MHPIVPVYVYYADGPDKLVAAGSAGLQYAKSGILSKVYPGLNNINTEFATGSALNTEAILKLEPDVALYTGETQSDYTALTNVGIPAVGFTTAMGDNSREGLNPFNHLKLWLEQLETIFGDNGRADSLIAYGNEVQRNVANGLSGLQEKDKPKVLIIFSYTPTAISVAGSNHYSEYWIEASGGINAAKDVKGIAQVNMERILEWNPDIIYFANGASAVPEDLYSNNIAGHDWSSITAVKNKDVHIFPSATYMSYAPSLEAGLVLQWLAKTNHPALFSNLDLVKETTDYFKEFFNYNVSVTDVDNFLNPKTAIKVH